MMYSKETISKYADLVRAKQADLDKINPADLNVIISRGNQKIGKVLNVSLLPIFDCANCSKCAQYCYDIKACMQYKNVLNARAVNSYIFHNNPDKFFADIEKALNSRKDNKYMRYQVAGDIPNMLYLDHMVRKAQEHPDFVFWTYTKRYSLVNEYVRLNGGSRAAAIPANLSIMFSPWTGCAMENPYNFPVFAVRLKNGKNDYTQAQFDNMFKCPGQCAYCIKHKRGCIAGENTFNDEH